MAKGIAKDLLGAGGAVTYATNLCTGLIGFAAQYQLAAPSFTPPSTFDDVPKTRKDISSALPLMRSQHPVLADQGQALSQKNKLDGLKTAYAGQKQAVTDGENALRNYPERRSVNELDSELGRLSAEIGRVDAEMLEVGSNAKLLDEAFRFFQVRQETGSIACPLCGATKKTAAEWRTHMQAEIDATSLQPLRERKNLLAESARQVEASKKDIAGLNSRVNDERGRLKKQVTSLEQALSRILAATDDPLAVLDAEINKLSDKLDNLQDQVTMINQQFASFDDRLRDLDVFGRIGKAQKEIDQIEDIQNHASYQKMNALRTDTERYVEDVALVIEGVSSAVRSEAKARLESAGEAISAYFAKITDRPDFKGLAVTPTDKGT